MSKLFSLIPDQIRDKLPLTEDKKQLLQPIPLPIYEGSTPVETG